MIGYNFRMKMIVDSKNYLFATLKSVNIMLKILSKSVDQFARNNFSKIVSFCLTIGYSFEQNRVLVEEEEEEEEDKKDDLNGDTSMI